MWKHLVPRHLVPSQFVPRGTVPTLAPVVALAALVAGCGERSEHPMEAPDPDAKAEARLLEPGPYEFAPPVFDIAAAPDGSILVPETVFPAADPANPPPGTSLTTVQRIVRGGRVRAVAEITTAAGSPINGVEPIGAGSFFATGGALDLAVAGAVFRVSNGVARLVGDIEAFETANDPDAFEGPRWKNQLCEAVPPFSAGPQSNPYHLAKLSGRSVLVADAAGNTVLSVDTDGAVDWVAILTPPVADGSSSDDPADWMVLFPLDAQTDCYVQPVATSVAIGPDGAYYVGELTGVTPADLGVPGGPSTGLSRVWRIEPGARNVVCPSASCRQVLSGFTSVIDLAFGPDGRLHVVEYDQAGWWTATVIGTPTSGAIHACDVGTGACDVVDDELDLPAAITFDKWGGLWVLENNLGFPGLGAGGAGTPTVRRLDLD